MVKNEQHGIAEWLSYHFAIGFDVALVLDNGSSDDTPAIVRAAAQVFDVRLRPVAAEGFWTQMNAYVSAARDFGPEFDWIAFIDTDEFIAPVYHAGVKDLFARLDPFAAIALNWRMYGSSGHENRPEGLTLEAFRRCAPPSFAPNAHVKSIVRPGNIVGRTSNPHVFEVERAYVDALGRPIAWGATAGVLAQPLEDVDWYVNHYFVQSKEQWLAKLARGYADPGLVRRPEDFALYDRNDVLQEDALRFARQTHENLAQFPAAGSTPKHSR